jgi:hypothetical protein
MMTNPIDDFTDYSDLVPDGNIDVEDSDMDDLVPDSLRGDEETGGSDDDLTVTGGDDSDVDADENPIAPAGQDRLLADKYRSVAELERGYKELQAYTTRLQQGKINPTTAAAEQTGLTPDAGMMASGESRDQIYARVKDDYSKRYYELVEQNYDHETAQQKAWDDAVYQDRIIQQRVDAAIKSALPQVYQTVGVDIIGREIEQLVPGKDARITAVAMKAELNKLGISDDAWLGIDPQTKTKLAEAAHQMAIGSYYQNRAKGKPGTPDVPPTSVAGKGSNPTTAADLNPTLRAYAQQLMSQFNWTEEQAVKSVLKNTAKK